MLQVMMFGEANYQLLALAINEWLKENVCMVYNIQYQVDNGLHCAMVTYNKNLLKN